MVAEVTGSVAVVVVVESVVVAVSIVLIAVADLVVVDVAVAVVAGEIVGFVGGGGGGVAVVAVAGSVETRCREMTVDDRVELVVAVVAESVEAAAALSRQIRCDLSPPSTPHCSSRTRVGPNQTMSGPSCCAAV